MYHVLAMRSTYCAVGCPEGIISESEIWTEGSCKMLYTRHRLEGVE